MDAQPAQPAASRQRRYTDQDAADTLAALAEQGGNVAATSRTTGVPEQTIRDWRDGNVHVPSPEVVEQRKAVRALKWDAVQDAAVEQVLARLPEASARDAAVVAGIAVDKGALLRGEATQIVSTAEDERVNRLRELYARRRPVPVTAHDPAQLPPGPESTTAPADGNGEGEATGNAGESGG